MGTPNRTLIALAMSVALAGCDPTDLLGPVQPEEVTITLSVSGGIAGVQFGVVVDGAAGEARLSCSNFCAVGGGEAVIPLSPEQVGDLARRLDEVGVIAMGDRDFGNSCCDMFGVALTYQRGARSARLQGSQNLWPLELSSVIQLLSGLALGRVPLLVSPDTDEADWPRDPFSLADVTSNEHVLTMEVTYGGGCGQHRMDLVAWGGWLESFPVQVNGLVTHDDGDDACDAIVTEERVFDLRPLHDAYVDAYGPIGSERPTVVLRLREPASNNSILVEIVL